MKIAFIGGGNMGEAILAALIKKEMVEASGVTVADVKPDRRQYLNEKYAVRVVARNTPAVKGAEVVILAVKPQNLSDVLTELSGEIKPEQLVLSIIAGARLATMSTGFKHDRIVRAMPNTPGQIGAGITVWTATPEVREAQRQIAADILSTLGRQIYMDDEKYLDMAPAVSGSGPAYFFYMIEALVEGGTAIGLPRQTARELALRTMMGAGRLLEKTGLEPADLRRQVTSPGGTTAAAIAFLEQGNFPGLLQGAVRAAYDRAIELGK